MPKRYLRLEEAADKIQARGFATGRDYHALSTDDKLLLHEVMGQTMWRQSPAAAVQGRSRSYSFWSAVSRYWSRKPPRRRRATSTNVVRGPELGEVEALGRLLVTRVR